METFAFTSVPMVLIPRIGALVVAHAQLDAAILEAIQLVAELDRAIVVAFAAEVTSTTARAEILKNAVNAKVKETSRRAKLLILANRAIELCNPRNKIVHLLPYSYNVISGQVTYFDPAVTTSPQIKRKKPITLSPADFDTLTNDMLEVTEWLLMLRRQSVPDGVDVTKLSIEEINSIVTHHPNWDDDTVFPWKDKLAKELRKKAGSN